MTFILDNGNRFIRLREAVGATANYLGEYDFATILKRLALNFTGTIRIYFPVFKVLRDNMLDSPRYNFHLYFELMIVCKP